MTRPEGLNKKMISDLRRLCECVDCLYHSADYKECGGEKVVDTVYWLHPPWEAYRQYADCIFYSSGRGWRLRKHWRERLTQLELELEPQPKPGDAVLGGQPQRQPHPDDAVLGGQP